jgi:hypothetical protein
VVAFVVGGLLVLVNLNAAQPAGRDTPTRVLPGSVPRVAESERRLALTGVSSDPTRDRITYAWELGSISLELDRTRAMPSDGEPVVVRGELGRRTDSTLSWLGPDDALVEVSWSGQIDDAMIDSFAQAIVYVDDDTWAEAADTGGFQRPDPEPLANVRIDADVPFDVDIVGDLHEGLSIQTGSSGLPVGGVGDRCGLAVNYPTPGDHADRVSYVVFAPSDVTSAVVRPIGRDERRIELTSLRPLVDIAIGGVVYDDQDPGAPLPQIDCEGES